MLLFNKTQRGMDVLQNRSLPLTARQRQLLVLIGSEAFDSLNEASRLHIARPELLLQLCQMGLITPADKQAVTQHQTGTLPEAGTKVGLTESEIHYRPLSPSHSRVANDHALLSINEVATSDTPIALLENLNKSAEILLPELQALSFEDLKYMMMDSLQKHCGLMAKEQIQHILNASNIQHLKRCQMRWITTLQESRIHPQELNYKLQQINLSYQKLQSTVD
ncbi:MAG TPA: hypothetical protein K8V79_10335 [Acinetobacter lwoffii]|uniref:Uncharacterized protein n=1 Tax=Acinetobacter lwoffii TaxID=28090 RepID=A0A9D2UU33_ACILW|nr:hypothetical protein [Acinetobacter lwoffii]